MRLHRLEVEGFGPFRSRQSVDFDEFADDGIFLIAGRTGAGKSSILDAVCFGLYGGVPRYDGGEKRLRSDHCEPDDPSEVVVEFSTPAGRFRVTRSPEYLRPAKRGGGLTKQASAVTLEEWTDNGWIGRSARAVDVGNDLDEILQLSREQFLQVILLAQNRFSEFLLANSKDRQSLLRRLFGTQRFEDVQARFEERRRTADQELGARLATVTARVEEAERLVGDADLWGDASDDAASGEERPRIHASTDDRLDDLTRAQARAEYRAERRVSERRDAEMRSAEADSALTAAREDQRMQAERDRARGALARLDADESLIVAARAELSDARAAESLRSGLAAAERAQAALVGAEEGARRAQAVWDAFGINAGDLEVWAAERTREIGSWERAAALETQADALVAELRDAEQAAATIAARLRDREAERAVLPAQTVQLTAERDEARRLADRVADLAVAVEGARVRATAVREYERLDAERASAEEELGRTTDVHALAQTTLAQLRRRRLDGFAGELASGLAADEPCPVCGSFTHPSPAAHADPVTADDVLAAERMRDEAATHERAAAEHVAALRVKLASVVTRAEGRSHAQADAELSEATAQHAESVDAGVRTLSLDARLEALFARAELSDAEHAADAAALTAAREQQVVIAQRNTEAQALIAEARGNAPTVADRLAEAGSQVVAAHDLAESIAEHARREQVAKEAAAERDAALADSPFADTAAVEQALRPAPILESLDAQITAHSVQREKERAILFDLELRTLPEDRIDLAPAELASTTARAAWSVAVDEASRASGVAERIAGLIVSAAAEHARTASQTAEFDVLRGLADTIAGRGSNTRKMTLETFVLAAELEEIVEAANRRLSDMSTGRYRLQHSDALASRGAASGLGIVVFDAFTGRTRPAQSLSGGETFLSSLALALGLAEVVTARAGGIRLDTLFIDEGFGSLDGDTLDVAMRTLDELRQGGRTVGVISHVEAMQEQIPAQLTVRATPEGPSIIEAR